MDVTCVERNRKVIRDRLLVYIFEMLVQQGLLSDEEQNRLKIVLSNQNR